MAATLTTTSTVRVPPGSQVAVQVAGEVPVYLTDSVFKNNFQVQLEMAGFDVDSLSLTSNYGVVSRTFKGTIAGRYNATSNVSGIIAVVRGAAERAGAWAPTCTVPAFGQPDQPEPESGVLADVFSKVIGAVGDVAQGAGSAVKGAGKTVEGLPSTITLIIVGVVVIAGFLAFSPNVGKAAGSLGKRI